MINIRPNEKVIETEHLPLFECQKIGQAFLAAEQGTQGTLEQIVAVAEKAAIIRTLGETDGNRQKAAKLLDTAIRNLYYKIKKYNIKTF